MRPPDAAAIVLLAPLAMLWCAAPSAAQPHPGEPATGRSFVTDARGLELGATSGMLIIFPTFGGHVSLPVTPRHNLEVSSEVAPWVIDFDEGGDLLLVTQIQVRRPFRRGPPGGQRSLIVGVSAVTVGDRRRDLDGRETWDFLTTLRPHGGISWQWWKGPHLDVRLDVLGVLTGNVIGIPAPRASVSMVWHRQRVAS
jgi:hypothetical protein